MIDDARPFVAHHLRERADEPGRPNTAALHALARWAENVPKNNAAMVRIASCGALDYTSGELSVGPEARRAVDGYEADEPATRGAWLDRFASAIEADAATG